MDRDVRKLTISQEQYVETILEQHSMADCKPAKTPMVANQQFLILTEAEVDIINYQRYIGSLVYLIICMYSDIVYSVGILSQHVACSGKTHMQAIKYIFYYLCGTSHYKLEF